MRKINVFLALILFVFTCRASGQLTETIKNDQEETLLQSDKSTESKNMPTEHEMRAALQAYIDNFNAKNGEALAALFADDARIEDPVGGGKIVEGRAAIDEFYRGAVEVVDRLELAAPIRASHGNAAAMAFDIYMKMDDRPVIIRVIDVMVFNADGEIVDMKAYHGPGDLSVVGE